MASVNMTAASTNGVLGAICFPRNRFIEPSCARGASSDFANRPDCFELAGVPLVKLVAIALSLALDVFAVSIGVGMRGVPRSVKLRIGLAFACAEIGMNLIGAAIGSAAGKLLGDAAGYIGFCALLGLGIYMIYESRREMRHPIDMTRGYGLLIASLSISLDSLGIGFSILYFGVPVVFLLAAIGLVSLVATAFGHLPPPRHLGCMVTEAFGVGNQGESGVEK